MRRLVPVYKNKGLNHSKTFGSSNGALIGQCSILLGHDISIINHYDLHSIYTFYDKNSVLWNVFVV